MRHLIIFTLSLPALLTGCGETNSSDNVEAEILELLQTREERFCDPRILEHLIVHEGDYIFNIDMFHENYKLMARYLKNCKLAEPIDSTRYKITEKGKEIISITNEFLFGQHVFYELVEFTESGVNTKGITQTQVKYTTKYIPSDWFKDEGMPLGQPHRIGHLNIY